MSNIASSSKHRIKPKAGPPPAYFDGTPHFLSSDYQRVVTFGKRPRLGEEEGRGGEVGGESGMQNGNHALSKGKQKEGQTGGGADDEELEEEEEEDDNNVSVAGNLPTITDPLDSSDSEWEYEDLPPRLVVIDLGPSAKKVVQTSRQWSVSGLTTARPYLKLGATTFMGSWEETAGTGIVLSDERDSTRPFPHQHHPRPLPLPIPSLTHDVLRFREAINLEASDLATETRLAMAKRKVARAKARGDVLLQQSKEEEAEERAEVGQTPKRPRVRFARGEDADDDADNQEISRASPTPSSSASSSSSNGPEIDPLPFSAAPSLSMTQEAQRAIDSVFFSTNRTPLDVHEALAWKASGYGRQRGPGRPRGRGRGRGRGRPRGSGRLRGSGTDSGRGTNSGSGSSLTRGNSESTSRGRPRGRPRKHPQAEAPKQAETS